METSRPNSRVNLRESGTNRLHQAFLPVLALAVVCLIFANTPARRRFAASLTGAQATPANTSAGTGYGSIIASDDQKTVTVNRGVTEPAGGPGLSGTFTVGTGGNYPSLTNAGGIFAAINSLGASGNITINIISDLTGETGANSLNEFASPFTILIKPSGAARTVTGSSTTWLIRLNDADRVTIDGSTSGATAPPGVGGVDALRELTITNTNPMPFSPTVVLVSGVGNGAQNNTFKNLKIVGADPTTTLFGISLAGASAIENGLDNDNNRIENCSVQKTIFGIYSNGPMDAANPNLGTVMLRNDLSAKSTSRIRRVGILIFNDSGAQITENSVGGMDTAGDTGDAIGIGLGTQLVDVTNVTGGPGVVVTNATVSRNKINGISGNTAMGFSAAGIAVAGGTGTNTITNNMITGVIANSTSPDIPVGIFVVGAIGSSTRLYHNSISMTGNRGTTTTQTPSYGVAITGVDPTVELKNNIFYNTLDPGSGGANAKSYAIGMMTTTFVNLDSNFNDFFSAGPLPGFFRSGSLGAAAGTDYGTLALWRAAVADDINSQELDPVYVNPANDLHLNGLTTPLLGDGLAGFAITTDFDNDPRPAANPDVGADELVQAVGGSIPGGTYYNVSVAPGDSLGGNVTVTNALYLNGILNTGANTLTIDCNGSVSGAGPTNYVIGNMVRNFCAIGVKTFDVGTANGFSPASANATAGTFPSALTVRAVQGPQPNVNPSTSIQRYWVLTETGDLTVNLMFQYLLADVMGMESSYKVIRVTGGLPVSFPLSTVNTGFHQAFLSGVSNFSDWTVGQSTLPTAAPATISGRVTTTSGAPLAGVPMFLSGARSARAITDANGNYRFANIDTDNFYTVTPAIVNYQFSPASRSFSLLADVTDA
ncbi:MAG: beta strand repeat-containing protein, partial [Pyrinomonadaceae bacterium]